MTSFTGMREVKWNGIHKEKTQRSGSAMYRGLPDLPPPPRTAAGERRQEANNNSKTVVILSGGTR